jgi:hypothetical protein
MTERTNDLEGGGEGKLTVKVLGKRAMLLDILYVAAVRDDTTSSTGILVLATLKLGEAPLAADDDLLLARELELAATESLDDNGLVSLLATDRDEDLANVDTGNGTDGLTVGTTHTGLETISTGTRQHLVDTEDVEWVHTDTHVERVFTGVLRDVLVGGNTCSLKGLAAQLLALIGDQMHTLGELVNVCTLATKVEDADLWVGDTTTET